MNTEILYRPSYSLGVIHLEPNEQVRVEAGAMVSYSEGVTIQTKAAGGLFKALKRSVLGGESFFVNDFQASAAGGEVTVAPALPGDMFAYEMAGRPLLVQSGSYVASSGGVDVDTKWGGAKTFFASEGLFVLRCEGEGHLLLSSYGAIHEVELSAGQVYTVDTGHLVAWDADLTYNVRAVGGLASTVFSGEGLVAEFRGPGRLLLQTRSTAALANWLAPQIEQRIHTSSN